MAKVNANQRPGLFEKGNLQENNVDNAKSLLMGVTHGEWA